MQLLLVLLAIASIRAQSFFCKNIGSLVLIGVIVFFYNLHFTSRWDWGDYSVFIISLIYFWTKYQIDFLWSNFTNIKSSNFLYKSVLRNSSVLTVCVYIFWLKKYVENDNNTSTSRYLSHIYFYSFILTLNFNRIFVPQVFEFRNKEILIQRYEFRLFFLFSMNNLGV